MFLLRFPVTLWAHTVGHKKRILIPKEHGAWGILLVPFALGLAVAGQWHTKAFLLLGTILFLYLARYPLVLWARSSFKKFPSNGQAGFLFSLGHGLFLGALLVFKYELWFLIPLGGAGLTFLIGHLYLVSHREERTAAGELLGVCALTLTAPAAFYVSHGSMSSTAWLLWLLNILYFGSGIFYVRMKLAYHPRRANPEKPDVLKVASPLALYQVAAFATIALISAFSLVPALTFIAFVPLTIQMMAGTFRQAETLSVRKLGYTLVVQSVVYGLLLGAILRIGLD